ncbi:conjugal transfer transcriptional regulator TraJ [Yersinia enterocolitica]|nr:conjugal transfer protein TraJ [Yersinia enterocolitica]ELX2238825.1 conjugal transfer transcriptional regulator TraJ [Yersinia enterocolitica]
MIDAAGKKITRKHGRHLRVPVLPDEEILIKANAAAAGLSIAEYLRRLALGHTIYGVIDQHQVIELSKINADLGRLGGLLKLWLTNDERLVRLDSKAIEVLLCRISDTQSAMFEVVKKL